MKSEVLRMRRFTYEYQGVLVRCGTYFEQVCQRALCLRHTLLICNKNFPFVRSSRKGFPMDMG